MGWLDKPQPLRQKKSKTLKELFKKLPAWLLGAVVAVFFVMFIIVVKRHSRGLAESEEFGSMPRWFNSGVHWLPVAWALGLASFLINSNTRPQMQEYLKAAKHFFRNTILATVMGMLVLWVLVMVVETLKLMVTWTLRFL